MSVCSEELAAMDSAIAQLQQRGVLCDQRLLQAMRATPRSAFAEDPTSIQELYDVDCGTVLRRSATGLPTSSLTSMGFVARMLGYAKPALNESVLEIGTATGYTASLLARLVGSEGAVVTVEISAELAETARRVIARQGLSNVQVLNVNGFVELPEGQEFDHMVVTAATPEIPLYWLQKVRIGGTVTAVVRGSVSCFLLHGHREAIRHLRIADFVHFGGWTPIVTPSCRGWFKGECPSTKPLPQPIGCDASIQAWFSTMCSEAGVRQRDASWVSLPRPIPAMAVRSTFAAGNPQEHLFWTLAELEGYRWHLDYVRMSDLKDPGRGERHLRWIRTHTSVAELRHGSCRELRVVRGDDGVCEEIVAMLRKWEKRSVHGASRLKGSVMSLDREPDGVNANGSWCFCGSATALKLFLI